MKPAEYAYGPVVPAEWVFPDLDLLRALDEEPTPRQARVLAFRSPEPGAAEEPEAREAEAR